MAQETNPVQQRIEYLADSWNGISKNQYKLICTQIHDGDEKMIDAFYTYMLGLNNSIIDIEIILESPFTDIDIFSETLIKELEGIVELWNKAEFKNNDFEKKQIKWKPNYNIKDDNSAKLFIENIKTLVCDLNLQKGRFLVINLLLPHFKMEKEIRKWFSELLSLEFHQQVKILSTQTVSNNILSQLLIKFSEKIFLWEPHIDTSNVISKVAAMGDPSVPDTQYRLSFANLLKAVSNKDYKKTTEEGNKCLTITYSNVDKNPYWLAQAVAVNIILSNEDIRYNEKKKAFEHANHAIKMGELAPQMLEKQIGCSILAQAEMNKALILCHEKKWEEAAELYERAASNYVKSHINITAIEAHRMAAYCYKKRNEMLKALDNLYEGFRISEDTDSDSLKNSTYSLLLIQILKQNYQAVISEKRLNDKAKSVYGEDWHNTINTIWEHPENEYSMDDNPFITDYTNSENKV